MAIKKGGVPLKKPLPKVASKPYVAMPDVITRPSVTPVPSAAEVRAEREPAVMITRSARPSPWQQTKARLANLLPGHKAKREQMTEHMAAVKAGVLHELETLGVKKGVAVSGRPFGSPFAGILLPASQPKRKWGVYGCLLLLAVVFLGVILWFGRGSAEPVAVLKQALVAVREHDVRTFDSKVDVAGVATSVVNQMFNIPQRDNPLAARMTAFVKPGLAQGLRDEILATVEGAKLSDNGGTLLAKVWQELGGDELRVGSPSVAMQDATMAVAELPLVRRDLGLTLPLQVVLNRDVGGELGWQVVDIPNLAAVMDSMGEARRAMEARKREAMVTGVPEGIRVLSVKKLKDGKVADRAGGNLVVNMDVANGGATDAKDVQFEVAFGDAAGQPMMTTRLTMDGVLPAGSHREQVWTVPIDRARGAERYVADLPLTALTVTVTVVK